MTAESRSSRTDGLALFATAVFGLGVATTVALARVGAPDGLVLAVGPVLTLAGSLVVGVGAQTAELASFLVARRALRPVYGALNVAAVSAGLALCLDPDLALASDPAWFGVAAGLPIAVMGFQPVIRAFGATSAGDVIATRFGGSPAHVISALAIWAAAALTALAGYRGAVVAVEALATPDRGWAGAIVALVALGWALGWSGETLQPALAQAGDFDLLSVDGFAAFLAAPLALGFFFAFEPPAVASRTALDAVKAGFFGAALCLALAAATISSASPFRIEVILSSANAVQTTLVGAAVVAAMLALARVAAQSSSRALGLNLAAPPKPFPPLASVRLARMRAAQLALVIACVAGDRMDLLDSKSALLLAMAASLAATAPLVALAFIRRVGSLAASGAAAAGLALALLRAPDIARVAGAPPIAVTPAILKEALFVAAAAFAAGLLISLVAPRRGPAPAPHGFDPFADGSARGVSSRRTSS